MLETLFYGVAAIGILSLIAYGFMFLFGMAFYSAGFCIGLVGASFYKLLPKIAELALLIVAPIALIYGIWLIP